MSYHLNLKKNRKTAPTSIIQADSINNQLEQSTTAERSPSGEEGEAIFRLQ
jgi:hypothetical protein